MSNEKATNSWIDKNNSWIDKKVNTFQNQNPREKE